MRTYHRSVFLLRGSERERKSSLYDFTIRRYHLDGVTPRSSDSHFFYATVDHIIMLTVRLTVAHIMFLVCFNHGQGAKRPKFEFLIF